MQKNNTGSLDTNILLRLVIGDIPEQTRLIHELLENVTVLQVADIVIFEMVFILDKYYELSRKDIIESLYTVIRHEKINCNRWLFESAITKYMENPKLSFVDCTLPYYAALNNAVPLYTFDQALAKASPDNVTLLMSHGT